MRFRLNFKHFQKKMTLIADVFPKLQSSKNVFKEMSKKSCFRGPFDKQHGKVNQTMLKSERHQRYHFFSSLCRQLSWKKSVLVICKVLRMFVNVLNADDKCFLLNRDNLRRPIQKQLSEKQKTFLRFFLKFSNLD